MTWGRWPGCRSRPLAFVRITELGSDSASRTAARNVIDDTRASPDRLDARAGQPLPVDLGTRGGERRGLAVPSIPRPGLQGCEAWADPGQATTFTQQLDAPGTHEFIWPTRAPRRSA